MSTEKKKPIPPLIVSTADIDPSERYRYLLTRIWGRERSVCAFIGLSPSSYEDDAVNNNATVRRCMRYAFDWGYGGLWALNLYAHRSDTGWFAEEPIGTRNDMYLARFCQKAGIVVAAWGKIIDSYGAGSAKFRRAQNRTRRRIEHVSAMIRRPIFCLGLASGGDPRHPLYMPRSAKPILWRPQIDMLSHPEMLEQARDALHQPPTGERE